MEIRISTETIDSYGELTVHKFDTFRKARAYWKELFDDQVEKGGGLTKMLRSGKGQSRIMLQILISPRMLMSD